MTAPVGTFPSYGALLQRLLPQLSHALIAGADGAILWASDPQAAARLDSTRAGLVACTGGAVAGVDGSADAGGRFGLRVRGADGAPLAFVLVCIDAIGERMHDLAAIHALLRPALDCLQNELAARTLPGGADELGELPAQALRSLSGSVGVLLLPDCNLVLQRCDAGCAGAEEVALLAQLHELLLTRAQVQRRTLLANRLQPGNARAPLPYKVISAPVFDALRRVVGVLAVFRAATGADFQPGDVDGIEMLARRAGQVAAASYDFTTGFLTEAAFVAQGQARLDSPGACAGSSGVLYCDVDQLHVINESHGMPVGDEILQKIALLLRSRARGGTLVARIAGDRFAMFVPGCSIEPVARIAEEIRASAVRLSGPRLDKALQVSLSVGVARIADGERQFGAALASAAQACWAAKERGRNRVEVFYGNLPRKRVARGAYGAAVRAVPGGARDSLELLVQPVLPLGDFQATPRFEILMRMRTPDGARLNFDKLLEAGADEDLPRSVDWWVIEQAVARLAAQRELLREYPAQFSINLSPQSLAAEGFWPALAQLLCGAALPAGALAFEFTAAAALAQVGTLPARLHRLRELGVCFAIDQFGQGGIGSLSSLAAMPLSCIKIDGALSRDLDRNPHSQSAVVAITRLAQGFGLESVVTQVETDSIRACAAHIGVDFGQGFFIGRLLDLDTAIRDLPLYSCFEMPLAAAG